MGKICKTEAFPNSSADFHKYEGFAARRLSLRSAEGTVQGCAKKKKKVRTLSEECEP